MARGIQKIEQQLSILGIREYVLLIERSGDGAYGLPVCDRIFDLEGSFYAGERDARIACTRNPVTTGGHPEHQLKQGLGRSTRLLVVLVILPLPDRDAILHPRNCLHSKRVDALHVRGLEDGRMQDLGEVQDEEGLRLGPREVADGGGQQGDAVHRRGALAELVDETERAGRVGSEHFCHLDGGVGM